MKQKQINDFTFMGDNLTLTERIHYGEPLSKEDIDDAETAQADLKYYKEVAYPALLSAYKDNLELIQTVFASIGNESCPAEVTLQELKKMQKRNKPNTDYAEKMP